MTKVAEISMLGQLDITVSTRFQVYLCVWLTMSVTVSAVVEAVAEVMKTDRRANGHTHRCRPASSMLSMLWSSLSRLIFVLVVIIAVVVVTIAVSVAVPAAAAAALPGS